MDFDWTQNKNRCEEMIYYERQVVSNVLPKFLPNVFVRNSKPQIVDIC
jgi:hypothetical protein